MRGAEWGSGERERGERECECEHDGARDGVADEEAGRARGFAVLDVVARGIAECGGSLENGTVESAWACLGRRPGSGAMPERDDLGMLRLGAIDEATHGIDRHASGHLPVDGHGHLPRCLSLR